jgi:hypothetical protein
MFTAIRTVLAAIFKGTCALVLGGTILGMVARNCDRRDGVAYVHVSTPGVDVSVDDIVYHVESLRETPIVCGLPPGRHLLRMFRGDAVLYEEVFSLKAGEEVVLCAWEQPRGSFALPPEPRLVQGWHRG